MVESIFMVRDDPKLPDDSGEVPKQIEVVGLIPGHKIVSLLDGKTSHVVQVPHVF